ncbi:MAG: hypothetical protein HOP19_04185 [Acidobacteria bacterium]|nr:hypothetical protein [Acidobacteriota bacterium]
MLELEKPKVEEPKTNRLVVAILGLIVVGLIGAVIWIATSKPDIKPALPNAIRAGNADFDNYHSKVALELVDKIVHPNMLGQAQYEIQVRVTNRGERTITGLELAGRMIDLNDQLLKEGISVPIPRARKNLAPGETFLASVKIDAPAKITEDQVKDLLFELRGLQF